MPCAPTRRPSTKNKHGGVALKISVVATAASQEYGRTRFKIVVAGAWEHTVVVKCKTDNAVAACCEAGATGSTTPLLRGQHFTWTFGPGTKEQ